jgi:zinc protease
MQETSRLSLTENVRQRRLANSLTILTKEVHTVPVVSVQVWYRFGSSDEAPGVNGIGHLLEHMMFKGTSNRPIQFGNLFQALGSDSNAFTSYDQTAYINTATACKLEALLVLEADRMHNCLMNADALETEKQILRNELLLYENSPRYRLERAVMRAAFPDRSYGLPVGGTIADIEGLRVEQVRSYYRNYYCPNNAVLVIVGDFFTQPTLATVREIFGQLPKASYQQESISILSLPTAPANTPIILRTPGTVSLLQVVYPLPAQPHPDVLPLQIMDYILTSGHSSRLYRALVESGLAISIGGSAINLRAGGWYSLAVTAAQGQKLSQIERVLQQAIAELQTQGVTAEELSRAQVQIRARAILDNRALTSQGIQLGDSQTATGDYRSLDRNLTALTQVCALDVQRVAQEYLRPTWSTLGFLEPSQQESKSLLTETSGGQIAADGSGENYVAPTTAEYLPPTKSVGMAREILLPEKFTLPNGLRLLVLRDRSTPTVTLSGYIDAGEELDPPAQAGLASMTAQNLMSGTQSQDKLTLAQSLEKRGAKLWFHCDREGVYLGGLALVADLSVLLEILTEIWQQATFPFYQVELSRQRRLTLLAKALDEPEYAARRAFFQAIYPENHPFHLFPTAATLKAISREDIVRFYQQYYRPDETVLSLVGDLQPERVRWQIENLVKDWQTTEQSPRQSLPPLSLPSQSVLWLKVGYGKAASITYMGHPSIDRRDRRFYAALVLNQILGGDPLSSRLGTLLRECQGLTYSIYSHFQASKNVGCFYIRMETIPGSARRAIATILDLLQELQEKGVRQSEVEIAKRSIVSTYLVTLTDPDLVCDEILLNEVYELTGEELRQFPQKIWAVTSTQVNQAIEELLHPTQMVVVTASPSD